ncbi:MAG: cell division protein FtsZ [Armatimonadetes bacterium]|nr:cell division protein FtsZ [Armatimonadota bacterium]
MNGPIIRVIGVGNGGCNAVSQIMRSDVSGVELFAVDTDVRKLRDCAAPNKIVIGQDVTQGLGCGGDPEQGRRAAESSAKDLENVLSGAHMVFVAGAMGGGTGTGAAPVICRMAKDMGALTVGICTKPFRFERQRRMATAMMGIEECGDSVDALITIDNQRLFDQVDKHTRLTDAFALVDDVLRQAVQGVSDLITIPGTINVDFADVCSVLRNAGPVLMGMSESPVDAPSTDIVSRTVASPLLENGIVGATNLLLNITCGPDLSLWQVHDIADAVAQATQTDMPSTIFGTVIDEQMKGKLRLTILAASFVETAGTQAQNPLTSGRPLYSNPPTLRRTTPSGGTPIGSGLPPAGGGFQSSSSSSSLSTPSAPASSPGGSGIPGLPTMPPPASGSPESDLDMPTFVRRNLERRGEG